MNKPTRYGRILDEIRRIKATRILEVGTWSGDRASEMVRAAASASPGAQVAYYGFDLFEDMDQATSKAEFNVKKPHSRAFVEQKIQRAWRPAMVTLFRGNTKKTLPEALQTIGPGTIDLAWIDGGHSVETVRSDWTWCTKLMRKGGVVLLDDHYSGMPPETLAKFGCNRLFEDLRARPAGQRVASAELFPEEDPVHGGGTVRIARVVME